MKISQSIRNDWTKEEVENLYHQPLLELVYQAATVHRTWHNPKEVQICTLLSVKQAVVQKIVLTVGKQLDIKPILKFRRYSLQKPY